MCLESKEGEKDLKEALEQNDFLEPNDFLGTNDFFGPNDFAGTNDFLEPNELETNDLLANEARQFKRSPWFFNTVKKYFNCAHNCWHNDWKHRDWRARGAGMYYSRCSYRYRWGGRCYCYGKPKCG